MRSFYTLLIVFSILCLSLNVFAQENKTEGKFEKLVSERGKLVKLEDFSLDEKFGKFDELFIRKVKINNISEKILVIDGLGGKAFVHQNDLSVIISNLEKLKTEQQSDLAKNRKYIENKFISDDGLIIGYTVSGGKLNWVITDTKFKLSVEVPDYQSLITIFKSVKKKIASI